jgi:hypothetical protein
MQHPERATLHPRGDPIHHQKAFGMYRVRKSFEGVFGLWGPAMESTSAGPSKSQKSLKAKPYPT